jgi:hypothetical protein
VCRKGGPIGSPVILSADIDKVLSIQKVKKLCPSGDVAVPTKITREPDGHIWPSGSRVISARAAPGVWHVAISVCPYGTP